MFVVVIIFMDTILLFVCCRSYACGDIESQVKMALRDLTSTGFVRYVNHGYRTLGPYAKLALARTSRQYNIAWDHLNKAHKISSSS